MNKLTLKHLAPYLPYRLKISFDGDEYDHLLVGLEDNIEGIELISEFNDFGRARYDKAKPILRPLSDITSEILHDGKMFVPKEVMFEKYKLITGTHFGFGDWLNRVFEPKGYDKLAHWMYQDLIKWHFDVFGLIEQNIAIDINSI